MGASYRFRPAGRRVRYTDIISAVETIVFGGSFDPPHEAHLKLLAAALKARPKARALVLPAWRSPLKGLPSAAPADRLAMTAAALKALSAPLKRRARIDDWELRRGRVTYTFETLRRLHLAAPSERLFFLAGADSWESLPRWKRPAEIGRLCSFLVGRRPGAALPRPAFGLPRLEVLPGTFPDLSSTLLRARLLLGEEPKELPAPVRRRARTLYGAALRGRLARELPGGRWEHTRAVARMALALALEHGLDPERAALAGLLHDCGRAVPAPAMGAYAKKRRLAALALEETAARAPILLHAHISEDRARREYGVTDPAVLSAVRKHTLGDAVMTPLDRLLYAADACSADRSFPEAARIRRAAVADLDGGFREAMRVKLDYVLREGAWLHPGAAAAWNAAWEDA
jgi:nicotinate-nucleotide adenylyltransferase